MPAPAGPGIMMENPNDPRYRDAGEVPGPEHLPLPYLVYLTLGTGPVAAVRRWWQRLLLRAAGAELHDPTRRCWEMNEETEGRPCALTLHHPGPHAVEPLTATGRTLDELLGEFRDRHRYLMNQRDMKAAAGLSHRLEALALHLGWQGLGRGWPDHPGRRPGRRKT